MRIGEPWVPIGHQTRQARQIFPDPNALIQPENADSRGKFGCHAGGRGFESRRSRIA